MTDDTFDLDAARLAEADASRRPLPVRLGGKTFQVPRPLPLGVGFGLAEGDWKLVVDSLFGEQAREAVTAGLTSDDVILILDRLTGGPGKSGSSSGSSRNGRTSKPTSKRSTGSTLQPSHADG